jgi:hypothetical protein
VLLKGATTDGDVIVTAVRLLQGIEGVKGVKSNVSHVAFFPQIP